jgi:hypothetical protein
MREGWIEFLLVPLLWHKLGKPSVQPSTFSVRVCMLLGLQLSTPAGVVLVRTRQYLCTLQPTSNNGTVCRGRQGLLNLWMSLFLFSISGEPKFMLLHSFLPQ